MAASLAGWGVTAAPATAAAPPPPPIPPLPTLPPSQRSGADPSPASDAAWRAAVGSPAVAAAWEGLAGGIVQEFIYDAWWGGLSPDTAFPASVRAALNSAFGELAIAARGVDVRRVALGDAVDLLSDHLTLFRDARAAVCAGLPGGRAAWAALPPAARERALARELRATGNLHPALLPPGAAGASGGAAAGGACGHYAVLSRIGAGLAACLLTRPDFNHPALRPLVGELLAGAVLKPIIMLFQPHSIARMALNALRGADARQREAAAAVTAATAAAAAAAAAGGGGPDAVPADADTGHIGSTPAGGPGPGEPGSLKPTASLFPAAAAALHPTQGAWEFEARARRSAALEAARAAGKAERGGGVGGGGAPPHLPASGGTGVVSSPAPAWTRAHLGGGGGQEGGAFHSPTLARSASEQGLSTLRRDRLPGPAAPADSAPGSSRGLTPQRRRGRAASKSGRMVAAAVGGGVGEAGDERGPRPTRPPPSAGGGGRRPPQSCARRVGGRKGRRRRRPAAAAACPPSAPPAWRPRWGGRCRPRRHPGAPLRPRPPGARRPAPVGGRGRRPASPPALRRATTMASAMVPPPGRPPRRPPGPPSRWRRGGRGQAPSRAPTRPTNTGAATRLPPLPP